MVGQIYTYRLYDCEDRGFTFVYLCICGLYYSVICVKSLTFKVTLYFVFVFVHSFLFVFYIFVQSSGVDLLLTEDL